MAQAPPIHPVNEQYGRGLRALRALAGMGTQRELARVLHTSRATVSELELGKRPLKAHEIEAACAFFAGRIPGYTIDDCMRVLRGRDSNPQPTGSRPCRRLPRLRVGLLKHGSVPRLPLPLSKARALIAEAHSSLEVRSIYLGFYAGLRVAEAAAVQASQWQDGWIQVLGKGRRFRELPVHPVLEAARDRIFEHPSPHRESVRKAGVRVAHRLGFHCGTHQFRKTFSSTLYDLGADGYVVDELLGHAGGSGARYIFASRRRKRDTIWPLTFEDYKPTL